MDMRKHHILYVEDHEDTRDLIRLILQQLGYTVTTVDTIAGALAVTSQEIFDLYLLDSRLPDGSGIDLCKQLRLADTTTPIVFYSAAAYEVDRDTAIRSGAQGYLVKPTTNGELATLINGLLK
ncbi:MAG TPA: response regulator [Pyrinomonadaceae bacterium]|nr:response regulator [Pyrinomonadaceae bacterium]